MKGFILSDNVFDGPQGTELHFWVKSEQGPLKLIFRGEKPVFFVENRSQFPQLENSERKSLKLKAFNGSLVDGIYFRDYKSLMQGRDKLANLGVRTYESDIRPNDRFLMERFINGSVEFAGTIQEIKGVKTIINPQVKKAEYIPEFSIMSLDIETSLGNDLYSIGLHQRGAGKEFKKVYMVGELENSGDVEFFPTEKALLQKFLADFPIYDPDLFVGWHVIGFDLKFLERKCNQYGLTFSLGRDGSKVRIQERSEERRVGKECRLRADDTLSLHDALPILFRYSQIFANIRKYLQIFANIRKYSQTFANICKYLQIFANICEYLRIFANICEYL